MPQLHVRQPEFTQSTCGSFAKHCGRFQKTREIGDLKEIYKNELDKARFPHYAAYFQSKDLAKRTISDKILKKRNCLKKLV